MERKGKGDEEKKGKKKRTSGVKDGINTKRKEDKTGKRRKYQPHPALSLHRQSLKATKSGKHEEKA